MRFGSPANQPHTTTWSHTASHAFVRVIDWSAPDLDNDRASVCQGSTSVRTGKGRRDCGLVGGSDLYLW